MACASGTSSGSSPVANSGSEEDLQALIKQRKLKRMLSNRESARRSRMRKQKHMDDLMAQVSQLRKENSQILVALNLTTRHYVGVEAENSALRTQMVELSARLKSLSEIMHCCYYYLQGSGSVCHEDHTVLEASSDSSFFMTSPWSLTAAANQMPIVASADNMFQDCPFLRFN
ncbi:hypothetical protein Cni_G21280 [Canna indica]|uniref:BZIP domain-containing protein n=1 Tax=Canna indica TaxID=4628 RepID=A0AAQ3KP75_9LILI|nr:hypothetical protein Cni_G21280 [Canna indica]